GDIRALQDANAHFSNDILTQVLNEPIKGKSYMWTSNQPFVLPVKILNFEKIAQANMAKEIQSKTDLLNSVFSEITSFNEIEKSVCEKTYEVIDDLGIDIDDRKQIFAESIKKEVCKNLYRKLNENEWEFLNDKGGIAHFNGQPFSVSYNYFEGLYTKTCIYIKNSKKN
ncbi:MAG: hypothetical protein ACFE9R_21355, partial [Candidatus Hermodarchaeota archaeon]